VDFEVRYLEAVLDDEPLLSDRLLALAEWMAQYYLAPLGEVLRGMLPLMAEVRRTVYYRITDLGRDVLAASAEGTPGRPFSFRLVNPQGYGANLSSSKEARSGEALRRRAGSGTARTCSGWPRARR
jgi:primosomal protein N'